jgi:hypothetical protein
MDIPCLLNNCKLIGLRKELLSESMAVPKCSTYIPPVGQLLTGKAELRDASMVSLFIFWQC